MSAEKILTTDEFKANECETPPEDGVIPHPCRNKTMEATDILYIPRERSWYFISQDFADELKQESQRIDDLSKPAVLALYEDASPEEIKKAQEALLEELNSNGALESYKTRSHLHFLSSEDEKKKYAKYCYTEVFLSQFIRFLSKTNKIPNFVKVDENFKDKLSHSFDDLGLLPQDLLPGEPAFLEIVKIARYNNYPKGLTITSHAKETTLERLKTAKNAITAAKEKLESKARKNAEEENYTWYRSKISGKEVFVKSDQTNIEAFYNTYKTSVRRRIKNLVAEGAPEQEEYVNKHLFNKAQSFQIGSVLTCLTHLNIIGIVVPEQLLDDEQIATEDDDTREFFSKLISELSSEPNKAINHIINLGESISRSCGRGVSWESFSFSNSEKKPINEAFKNEHLDKISQLGLLDAEVLSASLDTAIGAYIKSYVELILGRGQSVDGFGRFAFLYLMVVRYHIDFLHHVAEENFKKVNVGERKLRFTAVIEFTAKHGIITNPALELVSSHNEIVLEEYRFDWKEDEVEHQVYEYFLLSEKTKPRYIYADFFEKIQDKKGFGEITKVDLDQDLEIQGQKSESPQHRLRSGTKLKDVVNAARQDSTKQKSINFTGDLSPLSDYSGYTSAIQFGYQYAEASDSKQGALDYTISAEAELLRFSSDSLRFESEYPTTLQELYEKMSTQSAKLASFEAGGALDLVTARITVEQCLPHSDGFPMVLPAIMGEDKKPGFLHFGQLRLDVSITGYGNGGVGLTLAGAVDMRSTNTGLNITPRKPLKVRLPKGMSTTANVFAGARAGIICRADVLWQKPKQVNADNKNVSWINSLNSEQLKALASTKAHAIAPADEWSTLGTLRYMASASLGIGFRGTFQFGYRKRKFIIRAAAGATFGIGGSLSAEIAIHPEALLDVVNGLTDALAREDFHRVNFFLEKDENDLEKDENDAESFDGYKVLNTLITMTMCTGLDVGQLALLDFTSLLRQEKKYLVKSYAYSIAVNITKFMDVDDPVEREKKIIEKRAWFSQLPPESRGRLLYSLITPNENLNDEMVTHIEGVRSRKIKKTFFKDNIEKKYLDGLNKESKQWQSVILLLEWWSESITYRQFEESMVHMNENGEKTFSCKYSNKLLPYFKWSSIKVFIERLNLLSLTEDEMNGYGFSNVEDLSIFFDVLKDEVKKVKVSIEKKIETMFSRENITLKKDCIAFNFISPAMEFSGYNKIQRFGYYHLTRARLYSEEYSEVKVFTKDPIGYVRSTFDSWATEAEKQVKEEIMFSIKEVVGLENEKSEDGNLIRALDSFINLDVDNGMRHLGACNVEV